MTRIFYLSAFMLFLSLAGNAQTEKLLHQTIELDSIDQIQLEIYGAYTVEYWAGNNILTETKVKLYDAPKHVLKFFVEEQMRYQIDALPTVPTLSLVSHVRERKPISYKGTECTEEVSLRIFIPDSFKPQSDTFLVRE
ncbi:MAG: hypothetical protein AAFU60_03650 [Bacteroidota bacterium]